LDDSRVTSPLLCQLFLVFLLVLLLMGSTTPVRAASQDSGRSVRDVVRTIEPAIVWVLAQQDETTYTQGSGFILREDGYILTNAHVVKNSKETTIGWPNRFDRSQLKAEVVEINEDLDLALLHVAASHLPTVPISFAALPCVGDTVIALG